MRITIVSDQREFEGTPLQIVKQMRSLAYGREQLSISEYVEWLKGQVERLEEVSLVVEGESDEEQAESLVSAMIDAGLARAG